jgi:hypothetical protein
MLEHGAGQRCAFAMHSGIQWRSVTPFRALEHRSSRKTRVMSTASGGSANPRALFFMHSGALFLSVVDAGIVIKLG